MAKTERKKEPISLLLRVTILLAVLALIAYGVAYAIGVAEKGALSNQQEAAKERNEQAQKNYQIALAEYNSAIQSDQNKPWPLPSGASGWEIVELTDYPILGDYQELDRATLLANSPLMLTNRWHALPADYYNAMMGQEFGGVLVSLMNYTEQKVPTRGVSLQIMPQAATAILNLVTQAGQQQPPLLHFHVNTGFRSYEDQNALFEEEKAKHVEKLEGLALEEKVLEKVNAPGTSEFQTGFAFEMNLYNAEDKDSVKGNFQEKDQGKWFTQNSWKEGVILRFPSADHPNSQWLDKSYKTGVTAKYDFYRYVGLPHAAVMQGIALESGDMTKQMVLEEYIDYLTEKRHIAVYLDGSLKYEIYRLTVDEQAQSVYIPLPAGTYTEPMISYDNMGGVIVAITHN